MYDRAQTVHHTASQSPNWTRQPLNSAAFAETKPSLAPTDRGIARKEVTEAGYCNVSPRPYA
jgi:hypothetical protein